MAPEKQQQKLKMSCS